MRTHNYLNLLDLVEVLCEDDRRSLPCRQVVCVVLGDFIVRLVVRFCLLQANEVLPRYLHRARFDYLCVPKGRSLWSGDRAA